MKRKFLLIGLGATLPMLMLHYVYGNVGHGSHLEYERSYNEIAEDTTSKVTVAIDSSAAEPSEDVLIEEQIFRYSRFKHYKPKKIDKKKKPST